LTVTFKEFSTTFLGKAEVEKFLEEEAHSSSLASIPL